MFIEINVPELAESVSDATLLEWTVGPGQFVVEGDNKEPFMNEMNDLLNIEHDLETETLPWPKKLEDGFSAADLNVMELFFNLDEFEPKEE